MDSLISTFHIDWHLIVAQLVNFAVVILVLWRFALKPLGKLMDERGQTIAGGLENAKKQGAKHVVDSDYIKVTEFNFTK